MRLCSMLVIGIAIAACGAEGLALTSGDILARVKRAEAAVKDLKAEMTITEANKGNVKEMGKGYGDFLLLEKAVIYYKSPDKIRYDGSAKGINATYIQNGYKKLVLAAMIRKIDDVKNAPGKRQDSLDLGFLSSRLWTDNVVTVAGKDGAALKLRLNPKFGGDAKRHDSVWIDPATLKVLKREKYTGKGELRIKNVNSGFLMLAGRLPIATESSLYDEDGGLLGTVSYKNVKANVGLADSLFSLSTR